MDPRSGGSKGGSNGGGSKGGGLGRVGQKGGGPTQIKWGPEEWGPEGWGALNFALFFHSPAAKFVLFFPLWGSFRGILVVFEAPGRSNVHVWVLGLSCETPAAPKPSGLHTTAREPKRTH